MILRTVVISAVLAATVPVAAQQAVPGGVDPRRSQILTFEDLLRRAIEVAGDGLSKQVEQISPIRLVFDPAPVVRGWPLEGFGYHFDVQVPDMTEAGILVLQWYTNPPRPPPARPVAGSSGPRVSGGVVAPDPMGGGAAAPLPPTFDPVATYRDNVRLALIDAIINNPGVLVLRDTDTLYVTAAGVGQSALYRLSSRSTRLTLSIRGADLAALRQGSMTREEAKQRIRELYF